MDRDTKSRAPESLGRAYLAESHFNSVLALLHERTRLFDQYSLLRASTRFALGEDAVPGIMERDEIGNRIEHLIHALAEDRPEAIELLGSITIAVKCMRINQSLIILC